MSLLNDIDAQQQELWDLLDTMLFTYGDEIERLLDDIVRRYQVLGLKMYNGDRNSNGFRNVIISGDDVSYFDEY